MVLGPDLGIFPQLNQVPFWWNWIWYFVIDGLLGFVHRRMTRLLPAVAVSPVGFAGTAVTGVFVGVRVGVRVGVFVGTPTGGSLTVTEIFSACGNAATVSPE